MSKRIALALLLASGCSAFAAEPELRTAASHSMEYYVSLPSGWAPGKRWPVVVVVPDARRDFLGNLKAFAAARKERPFILVAPLVVTCGGAGVRESPPYHYTGTVWKQVERVGDFTFDSDGIAAVVADVRTRYGGEERYFLTGWEAGGHTVWAMVLRHPEALRAAAPVSTNWRGRWVDDATFSRSPARADLPVKVLFCGDQTAPDLVAGRGFWLAQTKEAMAVAEAHGYRNVSLTSIPGTPHGPLAADVLATFDALLSH